MFYTYMLQCADDTLYTGWTTDLARREACHNQGKGSKYTRARRPVRMVAHWCFATKTEAMQAEYRIKRYSRAKKHRIIGAGKWD